MDASPVRRTGLPATVIDCLATTAALGALLAAACNFITLAIYFFVGFAACVLARVLLLVYRWLPEEDKIAFLSKRAVRRSAAVSVLLGVTLSCLYWYAAWWLPWKQLSPDVQQLLLHHWRKLDYIPSVFSQLLPIRWQSGFHQYFQEFTYCFPGPYWWESIRYLRAAIPGYSLVFFAIIGLVRLFTGTVRGLARR